MTADTRVPRSVPRLRLRGVLDWTAPDGAYRAELTEYMPVAPVTSGSPALAQDIALPDAWWSDLKNTLGTLATVPTERKSVRQGWVDRNFCRFLGIDPVQIRQTTTGHADLHWANLTHAPLVLLDWENWDASPSATTSASYTRTRLPRSDRLPDPARVRPRPEHRRRPDSSRSLSSSRTCSRGVHRTLACRAENHTGIPVPAS
ncbi:hypothetical protein [Streptomyces sp. NPDC006334]|uniref:hypothetical protein n=1 Tax=Streptomyces sp. NPDC006334 TaxID=3156754 RepID=UPI0033B4817A